MPFNSQLEVMDANLLNFSVKLGHDLDKRFNKPFKMTMSQRDVPGTSRLFYNVKRERRNLDFYVSFSILELLFLRWFRMAWQLLP